MNKLYSVHDHWTDINKKNDVDIESIDGVITGIKVNGEDYGGGSSWQIVFEGNVTTTAEDNVFSGEIEGLGSLTANTIKVTFNGVEYTCERDQDGYYGAPFNSESEQYEWSEFPFVINTSEPGKTWLVTQTAGTYSLKIEEPQSGGSSDFSTATVSINIIGGSRTNKVKFDGIAFLSVGLGENAFITTDPSFYSPATIPFVLYQGLASATLIPPENFSITNVSSEGDVSVDDNVYVNIRGNGSITITISAD